MCVCVFMRAFLFGLSPRCINPMNPQSELVQLVLSRLVFNTCLMSLHMFICINSHAIIFDACFLYSGFIVTCMFTGFQIF